MHSFCTRASVLALVLGIVACDCEGGDGIGKLRPEILVTPNPIELGDVHLGRTVAQSLGIENVGEATLSVTKVEVEPGSHPGLTVEDAVLELQPGTGAAVQVSLTVADMGPISGAILVHSNDVLNETVRVPVTAVGVKRPGPAIVVCVESADVSIPQSCMDPHALDFGQLNLGSTVEGKITIRSVGDQPLVIDSAQALTVEPSITFDPPMTQVALPPDGEHVVTVRFTPAAETRVSNVFQIISNDPEREIIPVVINGGGVSSALCASPTNVDFGMVDVGQTQDRKVTLTSCGQAPIELTGLEIADGSTEFSILTPLAQSMVMNPGDTLDVDLRYAPADMGQDVDRLKATSDQGSVFVLLSGQTAVCDIAVTPTQLDFGPVPNSQSRSLNLLVENAGRAQCSLDALAISGTTEFTISTQPSLPASIAPGASETLTIDYAPTDAGSDMASLTITTTDLLEPMIVVPLSGRQLGIGECYLTAQPDPVAFGAVQLGMRQTMGVQVTNAGQSLCTVYEARTSASSSRDFQVTPLGFPEFLTAGSSFSVEVHFQPTSAGTQTGTLELTTAILPSTPPMTVQLSGSGAGAQLCPDPNPVVFGTHAVGSPTDKQLNLYACGTVASQITALSLTAATSSEYQIASAPALPLSIPAGSSITLDIRYTGVDVGRDDGLLNLISNDVLNPNQNVELIAASGSACGDIQGKVCGLNGSGPVSGATVYVDTPNGRVETTTNVDGDYVLTCVPAGSWTVHAEAGSWSTTFPASVSDYSVTSLSGGQCLNPQSARVAVVWGEWDQMEDILDFMNVPYTFYDQTSAGILINDPAELAQYDIVFLNCGFDEYTVISGNGSTNLQNFVANGGSVYASDYAYDAIEVSWPMFVDFYGDDNAIDAAQYAGSFNDLVDVNDSSLVNALGGRTQVPIDSCCTAMDSTVPQATQFLIGDRLNDGGTHPFFVGFQPSATSGWVMYTDFHNTGQRDILDIFQWLITKL